MDPATIVILSLFGLAFIRSEVLRIRDERRYDRQPKPEICLCGHGASYHYSGGCTKQVEYLLKESPSPYDDKEYDQEWALMQCECVTYVGPNTIIAPELIQLPDRSDRRISTFKAIADDSDGD